MSARASRFVVAGVWFTVRASAALVAPDPEAVRWLTQPPPGEAELQLRVTSVDAAAGRRLAELALRYRRNGDGGELTVAVATGSGPPQSFQLRGDASGRLDLRAMDTSAPAIAVDSAAALVPGTLLPWRILAFGWCGVLRVREADPAQTPAGKNPSGAHAGEADLDYFELVPAATCADAPAPEVWRVFLSREGAQPVRLAQLDAGGRARAEIEVLEWRDMPWGRAAVRSAYREPGSGARVLLEVRGGRVPGASASPAPHRKTKP